jgi:cell division protein FtsZ
MANAGSALMGIGSARGEDRAVAAAEMAVSSPLLEASIDGAHGVLLSIAGGSDLGLFEINEAAALVSQAAHAEANIIFGAVIDDALGDEVRVTVIAAGFDGGMPKRRDNGTVLRREPAAQQSQAETRAAVGRPAAVPPQSATPVRTPQPVSSGRPSAGSPAAPSRTPEPAIASAWSTYGSSSDAPSGATSVSGGPSAGPSSPASTPSRQARPVHYDDDELDVPDFLK